MNRYRLVGLLLLAYWLLKAAHSLAVGSPTRLLWLCNAGLLVAAAGFFLRRSDWLMAVVSFSFAIHTLWLFDVTAYLLTGAFLFPQVAWYVADASVPELLLTSHHVWLVPLCYAALVLLRRRAPRGWLWAAGVWLVLLLPGVFLSGNVNCAHTLCVTEQPLLGAWHPLVFYLATTLLLALPTNLLFDRLLVYVWKDNKLRYRK